MKNSHSQLSQIPLNLGGSKNRKDFASFFGEDNRYVVNFLKKIASNKINHCVYLWGAEGTGKSHLLQASCQLAGEQGHHVSYIPLVKNKKLNPDILHDLGKLDLVCIDDIHLIGDSLKWQQGLVCLYNELRDNKNSLLITSNVSPKNINLLIEDLKSRLSWDQTYKIISPTDELKIEILKRKAHSRSFDLDDDVLEYIMLRVDRKLSSLVKILDILDHSSLVTKRKITIPFVKEMLSINQGLNL